MMMWQDAAGTTPATKLGDPVRCLDTGGGPPLLHVGGRVATAQGAGVRLRAAVLSTDCRDGNRFERKRRCP